MEVGESIARIDLPGNGRVTLDRGAQTAVFATETELSPEAMLHPALTKVAAVIAWWMGRTPLHASAVVVDGWVWGLLGDRGAGKSTTAAILVGAGAGLLSDDLLVLDGRTAFAGSPTIDLRPEAARTLGGEPLGHIGGRERWRRYESAAFPTAPLAGFVDLGWTDAEPALTELTSSDRLVAIGRHHVCPARPEVLLALARTPMLRYARPNGDLDATLLHDDLLRRSRRMDHADKP